MESNTHSAQRPARFAALAAAINDLDSDDLQQLTDTAAADEVMELRPLVEQLEGQWLKRLAGVDGRGAAGAEQDRQFGPTAGWLRARLRMSSHAAATAVRTARALFRGPLTQTATALTAGELSASHAAVLASSTQQLPDHTAMEAEPTLLDAARHLDPSQLRRVVANLQYSVDADRVTAAAASSAACPSATAVTRWPSRSNDRDSISRRGSSSSTSRISSAAVVSTRRSVPLRLRPVSSL